MCNHNVRKLLEQLKDNRYRFCKLHQLLCSILVYHNGRALLGSFEHRLLQVRGLLLSYDELNLLSKNPKPSEHIYRSWGEPA